MPSQIKTQKKIRSREMTVKITILPKDSFLYFIFHSGFRKLETVKVGIIII